MIDGAEQFVLGLVRASMTLSIAAMLVAGCVRVLRVRSPRAEQIAWMLVLLQGVMLAQIFIPLPEGFLPSPSVNDSVERLNNSELHPREAPVAFDNGLPRAESPNKPRPVEVSAIDQAFVEDAPPAARSWSIREFSWMSMALAIWGTGLLFVLGIGAWRYWAFVRRLRDAGPATAERESELQVLLKQIKCRARLRLVVSQDVGPSLCRLPRGTVIVVPEPLWNVLNSSERAAVLRHEVEHFRRGDLWRVLVARLLASVHWFNPFAWWAAARFEEQGEFACDRAAAGEQPARFAELLLRLGSGTNIRSVGVQTMAAGSLYQRIQRLAAGGRHTPRWRNIAPLAVTLFIMGIATIRFSAMPAWVAAEDKPIETAAEPLPERAVARLGKNAFATRDFVRDLAFSPDGQRIAIAEANAPATTIRIFDVATATQVVELVANDTESGRTTCLVFAPDGEHISCGTSDGHIITWTVADWKEVFHDELHDGEVRDVAYSPDGAMLVTAGADGGLFVRSAREPSRVIHELEPGDLSPRLGGGGVGTGDAYADGKPRPSFLAFTPDGTELVVGYGNSGKLSVWNTRNGTLLHSFTTSEGDRRFGWDQPLHSVEILADGDTIVTAGYQIVKRETTNLTYGGKNEWSPNVRLWELDSGKEITDLIKPDEYGSGRADLSPDGQQIAIALYGQLIVRNVNEGQTRLRIPVEGRWTKQPTFSPDGKFIAMPRGNGLALFDAATGKRVHHDAETAIGPALDADWSPAGDRIATGTGDGAVRVWDADTDHLIWHRQLAPVIARTGAVPTPSFVAFSPDGKRVIAAGERDDPEAYRTGIMVVYDAASGEILREVEIERTVRGGTLSHDGNTAVLATNFGSINDTYLYGVEVATGRVLFRTPGKEAEHGLWDVQAIEFLPNSKSFRVATGDSEIIQFDAATGARQETLSIDWRTAVQKSAEKPPSRQLWNGAFSRDAALLVSSSYNIVSLWDAATGQRLLMMEHPHENGAYLGISPDGETIAASDVNYAGDPGQDTIRLYNSEGNQLLTLSPNDARARVLAFSPDGSKLFTGFYHKAPIVWDVTRDE